MIVRISGEGQFTIPDEDGGRLNELDNRAVSAVESGDETGFRELWTQMLELVTTNGNRSQAAEQLIIHRSTLDYRIRRIEQLTGLYPGGVRGINVLSAAVTAHAVAAQAEERMPCPAEAHIPWNT